MQDSKTNSKKKFLLSLRNLQAMSIATGQIHPFTSYHIHFSVSTSVKNVECNSRIWKTLWHSFQGSLRPLISIAIEMTSKICHMLRCRYHVGATRPSHFMHREHISMTSPSVIHHREGLRRFQIYMYVVKHVGTKMIAKVGSSVQLTSFQRSDN